ncbi:MAG: hypothetical protein ACYC9D_12870 [Candidatus Dormibacteria bacterium]
MQSSAPSRIATANPSRLSLVLKNPDAAVTIYLGYDGGLVAGSGNGGFPLGPGDALTLTEHKGDVWAMVVTGTKYIGILEEASA